MIRKPRFYVKRVPLGLDTKSKQAAGVVLIVVDEDLRDSLLINPEGELITIPLRGHRTREEELRELLRASLGATLIGEHAVGIAISEGLVDPRAVIYLKDENGRSVPYAVFMKI